MLGGLARWLRMLGHDVVYSVKLSDNELLELSEKEEWVLLTKDLELYKRAIGRCLEAFYVADKTEAGRLAAVSKRYGVPLEIDMAKSHCPLCNTPLTSADKEELKTDLQPNTYKHYTQFWRCPNCGQIYWQGSHWKQIQQTLNKAQNHKTALLA
jgi:uncharacterized protein